MTGGATDAVHAVPLSFEQRRIWLQEQLQTVGSAYHVTLAFTVDGPLRVDDLSRAAAELVTRHDALRTVFRVIDGEPRQVLLPTMPFPVETLAADGDPVRQLLRHAGQPFDPATGPLCRLLVVPPSGARPGALGLTVHHLVVDGWSAAILVRELVTAYRRPGVLGPPPLGYVDYTLWQREVADTGTAERSIAFWTRELDGAPALLDLPLDRPRRATIAPDSDSVEFTVPPEVAAGVEAVSRSAGTTPFAAVLAAFLVLLARHTGQERLSVAVPLAGRHRAEFGGTVGLFVNTVPLAVDLRGGPGYRDVVRQCHERLMDALAHSAVPFDRIVAALAPRRVAGETPYAQVACQLTHDLLPERLDGGDVRFDALPLPAGPSPFELTLHAEYGARLRCSLSWSTALFDRSTAERMRDSYLVLLAAAAAEPELDVRWLPLLTDRHRAQLIDEWSVPSPITDLEAVR